MNGASTNRGRVLIVDDEPELLEGMKALLEIEGIDVTVHSSMITLPLILREADPDLVLLDISLPALSGTSALRNGLRRLLRTDGALVLFSGRSERELSATADELGADGFITKASEPMEIVRQIRTWIDQRPASHNSKLREAFDVRARTASAAVR
jgi:DNA-binding response OmpR family regulator